MVIYADILVVINLFVNYFLLLITKRILHVCVRRIRILCGAVFGGLYSLIIFAPALPLAVTVLFHMAAVGILVLISFREGIGGYDLNCPVTLAMTSVMTFVQLSSILPAASVSITS